MRDLSGKAAEQAKWNRMARVSTIEPTAKQKEVQARWDMERRLGGTHSAKARTQAHFDAIDAERRKQEQTQWLVGQERAKQQDIIKGEVDKANAAGKWQAETARETALGVIGAAKAPYNTDYLKEKDALDAAREEKQHARALEIKKLDNEAAAKSAQATAALEQAKLDNQLKIEKMKSEQEFFKHFGEGKKEAYKQAESLFNMASKAERGMLSEEDLLVLDRDIDRDNEKYPTPELKAKAKKALRGSANTKEFSEYLMKRAKEEFTKAGY